MQYSSTQHHNEEEELRLHGYFSGFHIDPDLGAHTIENTFDYKEWVRSSINAIYVLPCYYPKCANRSATMNDTAEDILLQIYKYLQKHEIEWRISSNSPTLGFVLTFPPKNEELLLLVWYKNKERRTIYIEIDHLGKAGMNTQHIENLQRTLRSIKSWDICFAEVNLTQHG